MWSAHLKAIFLKWYWRALAAVIVAVVPIVFSGDLVEEFFETARFLLGDVSAQRVTLAMLGVAASVAAVGMYVVLTHFYANGHIDNEIHCRECGYILRGISEPRCPECGERI